MQGIEVGNTIDAKHDRFAIDHEMPLSVLQRGVDDPRIALGPVIAIAGDQAHAVAIALDAQAVAVIFYFVKPVPLAGSVSFAVAERGKLLTVPFKSLLLGAADASLAAHRCSNFLCI